MNKSKTCADCRKLGKKLVINFFPVYYCKVTDLIVPQGTKIVDDNHVTSFWRIPLNCHLSDDFKEKNENKIPESEWVVLNAS